MSIKKFGFTLVEVLIVITFVSLLFVSIATLASTSLRTTKVNEHKIIATHLGEELREWIRGEKEKDWETFISDRVGTWCFNVEPIAWSDTQECEYTLKDIFKRQAVINLNAEQTQATIAITVEWYENNSLFSIPITTVLSLYE